ncbi:hypothetical protein ACERCG_09600 [Mannheimia sp. E30BD]
MDNDANKNTEGKIRPTDNSGNTVQGIDRVLKYDYNVKGERTSLERDNNVDGKFDYREEYTLNANGNIEEKRIDLTNDGTMDRKEVYTKSPSDAYVKTEFYNLVPEGSGTKDILTKIEHYENNVNNQRTEVRVDILGDNTINSITRYDLDNLGRIAKAYFDTDGDKTIDRAESYTRDMQGNIIKMEVDIGNNGSIDSVVTYTYDNLGRRISIKHDTDNNGSIDRTDYYKYDVYGNPQEYSTDYDGDGIFERVAYREFDSSNRQIVYWIDENKPLNGKPDSNEYYETVEYDEYGNPKIYHISSSQNYDLLVKYDDKGSRSYQHLDRNKNGIVDNGETFEHLEYDKVWSRAVSKITVFNDKGIKTTVAEIEVGDLGNPLHYYRDNGADGTINLFAFGNYSGNIAVNNHHVDMSAWSADQVARFNKGLETVVLSNTLTSSQLTLDKETLANLVSKTNTLRITGDSTDTVNLEGFTKADSSSQAGHNQYTADVDGTTYTVFITDTVDTVLG